MAVIKRCSIGLHSEPRGLSEERRVHSRAGQAWSGRGRGGRRCGFSSLESGAPDLARLARRAGVDESDEEISALIAAHAARLAPIRLPVLQIHGEWDEIVPLEYALAFHEGLTTEEKELLIIDGAGHNDISWVGRELCFEALARFIART